VEIARHVPPAPLAPHVTGAIEGWEQTDGPRSHLREVPIPGVPVIVNLGSKWDIETDGRTVALDSFTGGLSTSPAIVHGASSWACVELRLTPLGARRLFGWPMHELTNMTVALEDVVPGTRQLVDRVRESPSWSDRFGLVDAFLLRRLSRSADPPPEIAWSWERLHASQGRASIGELAGELGWSHRRLIARFRDHIGLTPKTVARVIRFDRVVRQLRTPLRKSLADVAFDCGYFDQAHLNRDFREFADTTPASFVGAQRESGAIAA
jgi:AraC-like DNA-binding protein